MPTVEDDCRLSGSNDSLDGWRGMDSVIVPLLWSLEDGVSGMGTRFPSTGVPLPDIGGTNKLIGVELVWLELELVPSESVVSRRDNTIPGLPTTCRAAGGTKRLTGVD